ncbi:hypothetical protein BGX29_011026 [Mortierella sp. GBA35]|nr:hypothetical protein BGX29_011026 [Mortierella sp. GBA35]
MRRFFQRQVHKPPSHITTTTNTTTPIKLSPLDIPLILDIIFSFLNDRAIRYTVDLVLSDGPFTEDPDKPLRDLLVRHQEEYQRQLEQRNCIPIDKRQPTPYNYSPLRELKIQVAVQYETTIDSIPFPPSLTSLNLVFINSRTSSEDLGKIIRRCTLLEHLSIVAEQSLGQNLLWTALEHDSQAPLPLRSFTLRNISFSQFDLENMLSFTPRLKSLELMSMDSQTFPGYNWTGPLDHVKALSITLNSVPFPEYGLQAHLEITSRLAEICPATSRWMLWAPNLTPSSLVALTLRTSFLTTLELHWKLREEGHPLCCSNELKDAPRLLQDLLCTSPLLIHLKTLKAVVWPEHMDLFDRGRPETLATAAQKPLILPAIWVCRGLERLHIEIHEELFIDTPVDGDDLLFYTSLNLRLMGGFCLLSRLKYLQRVRIKSNNNEDLISGVSEEMDVNWITTSGRKDKFKRMRRNEVEKWRKAREQEDQKESSRPPQRPPAIAKKSDTEIWHQLRHIGLLSDVEEMVREIDTTDFVPFPSLERICFRSSILRRPEDELGRHFPPKHRYVKFIGRK